MAANNKNAGQNTASPPAEPPAEQKVKGYDVLDAVRHNQVDYKSGDVISVKDITDKEAKPLIALGVIKKADK